MSQSTQPIDYAVLASSIKTWGNQLGFQQIGICDTDLSWAEKMLERWTADGYHGEMGYMVKHGRKRSRPAELVPGTLRVISARMDYLLADDDPAAVLADENKGFVSRYALGRDYHRLMRQRLQQLATRMETAISHFGYRVFVDSAPVLEKPLAQKAGLGWQGKHSNLVSRSAGCWFFLGEIYTDLPLPTDRIENNHCGSCERCIDACPTGAITAPYRVDARRCVSYLTIELEGPIPLALRPLIGNRVYGCDDCLLACPWNRFALPSPELDFLPRNGLEGAALIELFRWSEAEFLKRLEGSPIRRIGHQRWLRNIAVALGNARSEPTLTRTLASRLNSSSGLVAEHVAWALSRHMQATQSKTVAVEATH
ncbi:MAG: tRNA epoxyqueuosine(34) reductase QueG [Gammaproteobacteria bacterium]|nr:tRNA epoxyqueuosine(34) reductase QueG [Gammaproteobacteria bacterium]